ncbi:hypothetical protein KW851_28875 [Pseudomonas sp. PDM33]|uniref:hypothetical protein n=1 Tax=Pseudomonas sp. PDM33 TaxID=2854765 RepID=UPI001C438AD4|nr:hypothetical protein [Pseudomonas sp. PDM33]MBV7586876.1 hypothetical protein [Pseudomonas sp. PDM33]
MKTDTTLRLGRRQYRNYAESAKALGCYLDVSTVHEMRGNWGMFNRMARCVFLDASSDSIQLDEAAGVTLASTIKTGDFRSVVRAELDWSYLDDEEIYPFILQHEIGHRQDNFDVWSVSDIKDRKSRLLCQRWIATVNEVFADRYAWSVIRPGEKLPVSENGKRIQQELAQAIDLISSLVNKRGARVSRQMTGQYEFVTEWMLTSNERMGFIGSKVSTEAVRQARESQRRTRQRLGYKATPNMRHLSPF